MKLLRALPFAFLLATMGFAPAAFAAPVKTPHVEAELIARTTAIEPGKPLETALRLKIIDHWHTYWQNPGDSGLPTKLAWSLPPGFTAAAIEWPYPKKLPLGPLMNYGYEGEVLHLVTIATPPGLKAGELVTLKARADWLVCSDVCIPESADVSLTLQTIASPALPDARWGNAFSAARAALPKPLPAGSGSAVINGDKLTIALSTAPHRAPDSHDITFYPLAEDLITNAGKQARIASPDGTSVNLVVPMADAAKIPKTLDGVLVAEAGWGKLHAGKAIAVSLPLTVAAAAAGSTKAGGAPAAPDMGLAVALAFAFLGGIILNLMPCVFPVLGIKVMGFAEHARSEPGLLRQQGLSFLAGVMVSFWVLAVLLAGLRAAGDAVGWGFQLQSPLFVTLLATLFFLMALNLAGLFEMGLRLQVVAGDVETRVSGGTRLNAFLSGVLATIVATPCTAPLMGAALGYTLSQPAYVGMLVFTAIGLGMALPVLALSFFPGWLQRLPKPGQWMETFKQLLAFPLFATVAWLAWVLGSQLGNDAVARLLFGLVIIALGAWSFGHLQAKKPIVAILLGGAIAATGLATAWPDAQGATTASARLDDGWVAFSRQKVADLRAQNRAVFVDFTATWCITCQVNKRVALNNAGVKAMFAARDIVRVKADWTLKDPEITAALAEFERNGVPLYVYYPPNGNAVVLPEVLTPAIVIAAIEGAPAGVAATK